MVTKKKSTKSFEDDVLDLMEEFHKIQTTKEKTYATLTKEIKNAPIKTASKVLELKFKQLELKVQMFEKFMDVMILIRNIGTKGGYKKNHLITEMDSYLINKKEYDKWKQ